MLRRRWVILVCCFVCSALGASAAVADPNPENNKQALSRTLQCDNGETLAATFAGLEGSNFNVTIDERVFVYKWIHIDRPPVGEKARMTTSTSGAFRALTRKTSSRAATRPGPATP